MSRQILAKILRARLVESAWHALLAAGFVYLPIFWILPVSRELERMLFGIAFVTATVVWLILRLYSQYRKICKLLEQVLEISSKPKEG